MLSRGPRAQWGSSIETDLTCHNARLLQSKGCLLVPPLNSVVSPPFLLSKREMHWSHPSTVWFGQHWEDMYFPGHHLSVAERGRGGVQDGLGLYRCAVWFWEARREGWVRQPAGLLGAEHSGSELLAPRLLMLKIPSLSWLSIHPCSSVGCTRPRRTPHPMHIRAQWRGWGGGGVRNEVDSPAVKQPPPRPGLTESFRREDQGDESAPRSHFLLMVIAFPLNADVFSLPESVPRGGGRGGWGGLLHLSRVCFWKHCLFPPTLRGRPSPRSEQLS